VSRTRAVLAVIAIVAFAGLTACGSDDSGGSDASGQAASTVADTTTKEPNAKATPVVAACHRVFDPYVTELREINNLAAANQFFDYRAETSKLISAYRKFDPGTVPSPSCQSAVGDPAAEALAVHRSVSKSWTTCIRERACSLPTIEKWQTRQKEATVLTDAAADAYGKVS
jgi:hypothetical protein